MYAAMPEPTAFQRADHYDFRFADDLPAKQPNATRWIARACDRDGVAYGQPRRIVKDRDRNCLVTLVSRTEGGRRRYFAEPFLAAVPTVPALHPSGAE